MAVNSSVLGTWGELSAEALVAADQPLLGHLQLCIPEGSLEQGLHFFWFKHIYLGEVNPHHIFQDLQIKMKHFIWICCCSDFLNLYLLFFSCNIFWSVFALIDVVNQWGMYRWDAMTWSRYVVCLGGLLTYWVSSPCLLVWWLLSLEAVSAKCLAYKISLKCESTDRETNDLE